MLILSVDTTTSSGSTALLEDEKLLGEINLNSPETHSERLLTSINFLLNSFGKRIQDIEGYALAAGPGSFTGVRIGMSLIKSFAFVSRKPAAPVSTLEALAEKMSHTPGRLLCPILDARKGEVYAALYERESGRLKAVIDQGVYQPDALFSQFPARRTIVFLGNGVKVYHSQIRAYFRDRARLSPQSFFIAYEVGILGLRRLRKKKGVDSLHLEPLYFRKSQAEEKRKV
ncbi:MAG: tRNA (adenosine(37)-N6)-threonylcarbamoyltransferase complex dimerization subunit type 1 TsaB [Candidatus Aminicenantes bacterium]|nr:tRNA (adenosine(37)-N6)-threonylcarbamoyltransferase complex dimerization subunit type 1 TsaB [Candidatus Aminicenantes bacterium]